MSSALARLPLVRRDLHVSDRPSSTAQWTTLGRALELDRAEDERIVTDRYAPAFLSGPSRRLLAALSAGGGLRHVVERSRLASIATSALCRHACIDAHLLEALPDLAQVLVLGAGYDSRAYRFRRSIGVRPVFEVDLPPLSRRKAAVIAAHPDLFGPGHVHRVEIDFRRQSLDSRLDGSRFAVGAPTFVVWEGVSMYLTQPAVAATLVALASVCGPGSVLAMDCWQRVGGLLPYDQLRRVGERAIALIGEPVTFPVAPDRITRMLDAAGFTVVDLALAAELTRRHATAGRHCDQGMYVLAARLR